MKILVYGAGVLGSYLAHALRRGGCDVTLLARGKRLQELRENSLVIRHYLQCRTTVDQIRLAESLEKDDAYDAVFVVVQRTQLDDVLPALCENEGSGLFVLVGNNPAADETYRYIREHSRTPKRVVFGFQVTGGRREKGRVISIHTGFTRPAGSMTLGSLDGDDSWKELLLRAFSGTKFKIKFSSNMDVWLKSHVAFIMPIAFACYYSGGNLKKIAWNRPFIYKMIDAVDEAYKIVEACGYTVEPEEDRDFVRIHRRKCYLMLKAIAATPVGKLACSDHAMSAKEEMKRLYEDFTVLKNRAEISTPAWDELARYMAEHADPGFNPDHGGGFGKGDKGIRY